MEKKKKQRISEYNDQVCTDLTLATNRRYMIPRPQCGRARRVRNPARRSWVRSAGFSVTGFSSRMILHSSQVKTLDSPQIDAAPASYCCGQVMSLLGPLTEPRQIDLLI